MVRQLCNDMAAVATAQAGRFLVGDEEIDVDEEKAKEFSSKAREWGNVSRALAHMSEPSYTFEVAELRSIKVLLKDQDHDTGRNLHKPKSFPGSGIDPSPTS